MTARRTRTVRFGVRTLEPRLTPTFFALDPKATFLHTSAGDGPAPAAFVIRLSDHGHQVGDLVRIDPVGDFKLSNAGPYAEDKYTATIAVFSAIDNLTMPSTLSGPSNVLRVPGAVAPAVILPGQAYPAVTLPTYFGNEPTDIPLDFLVTGNAPTPFLGVTVRVPIGANFLFLAARDHLYADNSDPDADYGVNITAAPFATVSAVSVNAGAAQRSRVTEVMVDFSSVVALPANPADAFQLRRQGDNAPVAVSAVATHDTATHVALSFPGAGAEFGSLADGRYTLTVLANEVNGGAFDGNGDGTAGDDYVLVGDPAAAPKLFRLFGDMDGDGDVDATDFGAFRSAFGGGSNLAFDFDGDGDVDAADFGQFRQRFGTSV